MFPQVLHPNHTETKGQAPLTLGLSAHKAPRTDTYAPLIETWAAHKHVVRQSKRTPCQDAADQRSEGSFH